MRVLLSSLPGETRMLQTEAQRIHVASQLRSKWPVLTHTPHAPNRTHLYSFVEGSAREDLIRDVSMTMTAALQSMVYGQSKGPTPEKGCAQSTCNFYMMPLALGTTVTPRVAPVVACAVVQRLLNTFTALTPHRPQLVNFAHLSALNTLDGIVTDSQLKAWRDLAAAINPT